MWPPFLSQLLVYSQTSYLQLDRFMRMGGSFLAGFFLGLAPFLLHMRQTVQLDPAQYVGQLHAPYQPPPPCRAYTCCCMPAQTQTWLWAAVASCSWLRCKLEDLPMSYMSCWHAERILSIESSEQARSNGNGSTEESRGSPRGPNRRPKPTRPRCSPAPVLRFVSSC